jgi:hypothetical protein
MLPRPHPFPSAVLLCFCDSLSPYNLVGLTCAVLNFCQMGHPDWRVDCIRCCPASLHADLHKSRSALPLLLCFCFSLFDVLVFCSCPCPSCSLSTLSSTLPTFAFLTCQVYRNSFLVCFSAFRALQILATTIAPCCVRSFRFFGWLLCWLFG